MKIVFFGSGGYVIPIIEALQKHGLELVITTESEGKLFEYLKKNEIPFISSHLKNPDDVQKVKDVRADLGVLASYGAILPQEILDLFPKGILNVHPSLLPAFKGPSPIQSTILSGVSKTGVTIIKLDDQVDHGPIGAQQEVELNSHETLQELKESLFAKGAALIEKLIEYMEVGKEVPFIAQKTEGESWTHKVTRKDAEIKPGEIEPDELERKVRAFYPWPGVFFRTILGGKEKIMKLLPEGKIQVEGKIPMDFKSFVNGYGKEAEEILRRLRLWE
ncbi:MAG: methionyl-tRNA formyltransferase [Candidatus Levyibacteriota bacterium]